MLGDGLKTNTTLTQLDLGREQQDHKETQPEQGKHNGTWSNWKPTGFVMKERVHWVMHSRQTPR